MQLIAQADPTPAEPQPVTNSAESDDGTVQVEEILVTGSRIKKADFAFANPVVSIDAAAIVNSGTVSITEFLKEIPALTGSIDSNDSAGPNAGVGGTGLELLDLRNLGADRTLVLIDGKRHVGGLAGSAAVDIDTIPLALIESIEVTTGGASAIYGADGVSGVVNFIMKRDFDGLDVRVQNGTSGDNDARSWIASAVGGHNFAGGRGNITGALEYSSRDRLKGTDRDFAAGKRRQRFVRNPNDEDDDPAIPDRIPLDDIRFFDSSRDGAVDVDFDFVNDFNGTGLPFDGGTFIPPFFQQGGDGTPQNDYIGDLVPDEERYTLNTFLTYRLSDSVRAFGDFKYSHTQAFTESQPTFDFFLLLEPDNPFTPPVIAAAADGEQLLVSRDHFDLGVRGVDVDRNTVRSVLGLDGALSETANFEVSVVYGQTDVREHGLNSRFNDRFSAAIDSVRDPATGQIVCRSNLDPDAVPGNLEFQGFNGFDPLPGTWAGSFRPGPDSGCVPANLFGDGSISPEAAAWINVDTLNVSKLTQVVFQAVIDGRAFNWFVPGGSPMGYAIGLEHRKEESEGHPAIEDQLGLTFGNVIQPDKGEYEVAEAFVEIDVPLVEDRRFAEYLGIEAAVRISEYSTVGDAQTWKVGSTWSPVSDLSFRATRAKATRAPNIGELFDPGGQTFQLISDPCDTDNLDNGSEFRRANCAALLSALGVDDPENFVDPNSSAVSGTLRGNDELDEEDANTTTLGFVLQPRFAPGLSLAIDWYDIEIENAINTATPEEAAQTCVDAPALDDTFCGLLVREPGEGGIVDFTQQPVNVARLTTKGYDFTLSYRVDPAKLGSTRELGIFNFRLIANKLQDLTFINLPGAPPDLRAGEGPRDDGTGEAPEWQASFDLGWDYGGLGLNYGLSYFDETRRFTLQEQRGNPDIAESRYLDFEARFSHDLSARYRFVNGLSIHGGVNNFTDEEPDLGEDFYPVSAVGRYFYAGVQWSGKPF
ncbi:MAG: TonB-dependent receptor plug domain-containing protein [Panacagrimonas sp.]